jgi:hypothetical protein
VNDTPTLLGAFVIVGPTANTVVPRGASQMVAFVAEIGLILKRDPGVFVIEELRTEFGDVGEVVDGVVVVVYVVVPLETLNLAVLGRDTFPAASIT